MKCNELLDWAEVVALVQAANEPTNSSSVDEASVAAAIAEGHTAPRRVQPHEVVAPALSVPAADTVESDPFAQRLG